MDGLKLINETFGFIQGDKVLKWCAEKLQNYINEFHLLGRWGEDEFIIFLPELDSKQAKMIKEKTNYEYMLEKLREDIFVSLSLGSSICKKIRTYKRKF